MCCADIGRGALPHVSELRVLDQRRPCHQVVGWQGEWSRVVTSLKPEDVLGVTLTKKPHQPGKWSLVVCGVGRRGVMDTALPFGLRSAP